MKMKGISRIVIVVHDEYRQKILKTLNKIRADILSVEEEERDDGAKVAVICAIVNERKYWKNRKKFLKFGDVAFLH